MQGGDAAGPRPVKAGVLRPNRMLGPDFGGVGLGRLIAVGMGVDAGRGIIAQMRMDVDNAGRHPAPASVEHGNPGRSGKIGANRLDFAAAQQERAALDLAADAVEDRCVGDEEIGALASFIGRRIWVELDDDLFPWSFLRRFFGSGGRGRLLLAASARLGVGLGNKTERQSAGA